MGPRTIYIYMGAGFFSHQLLKDSSFFKDGQTFIYILTSQQFLGSFGLFSSMSVSVYHQKRDEDKSSKTRERRWNEELNGVAVPTLEGFCNIPLQNKKPGEGRPIKRL